MNVHAFSPLYVIPASCAMCNSSSNVRNLVRANDFQSSSLCHRNENGEQFQFFFFFVSYHSLINF